MLRNHNGSDTPLSVRPRSRSNNRMPVLLALLWCLVITQMHGQGSRSPGAVAKFDIISIKPSSPETLMNVHPLQDGFSAKAMTAHALICTAYDLKLCDFVSNLPDWANSLRYDIEARIEPERAGGFQKLEDQQKLALIRTMLQGLLQERYSLIAHHAPKESPAYSLVVSSKGSKLKPASSGVVTNMVVGQGRVTAVSTTVADLAETLSDMVGRVVIDGTSLQGTYDFKLDLRPYTEQGESDQASAVFSALQDQLGLKLVPTKAMLDSIVVDRIMKPTGN